MDNWKQLWPGSANNPTTYRVEYLPATLAIVRWKNKQGHAKMAIFRPSDGTWTVARYGRLPNHVKQSVASLVNRNVVTVGA